MRAAQYRIMRIAIILTRPAENMSILLALEGRWSSLVAFWADRNRNNYRLTRQKEPSSLLFGFVAYFIFCNRLPYMFV
jgi:hypothetical protein